MILTSCKKKKIQLIFHYTRNISLEKSNCGFMRELRSTCNSTSKTVGLRCSKAPSEESLLYRNSAQYLNCIYHSPKALFRRHLVTAKAPNITHYMSKNQPTNESQVVEPYTNLFCWQLKQPISPSMNIYKDNSARKEAAERKLQ